MKTELYKKYRPTKFSGLVGQEDATNILRGLGSGGQFPHCTLFTGPSGCGKTTACRILQKSLRCSDADFNEINCADKEARGIQAVQAIRERIGYAPLGGSVRIWLLDECHRLTSDSQAAFLKMLEDTPEHVYFFLATTDPHKLLSTIKTRSTEIRFRALTTTEMDDLLTLVSGEEGFVLTQDVKEAIVDSAGGSARKALVYLNQILYIEGEEKQLNAIHSDTTKQTIELCRVLFNTKSTWSQVSKLLRDIRSVEEEPERVRRVVLGYAAAILIKGGNKRAFDVIEVFRDDLFSSGKAGLVAMCYETVGME